MEEKMKKMLFLTLFLIILGAANVTSQVRIGGNGVPNGAAVLDLNATDVINTGTKGLALPRVSLVNNTAQITSGTSNLNGMLVYNTNTALGAGVYYWDSNKWVKVSDGTFMEKDSIIGNEVVDATPGRGLQRTGSGTSTSPYTLGVAPQGIDTSMLAIYPDDFIYGNSSASGVSALKWVTVGSVQSPTLSPGGTYEFVVDRTGCASPVISTNWSTGPCLARRGLSPTQGVMENVGSTQATCHYYFYCLK